MKNDLFILGQILYLITAICFILSIELHNYVLTIFGYLFLILQIIAGVIYIKRNRRKK